MASSSRLSIGFQGGQVLAVRLSEQQLKDLVKALGSQGWHEIESEDGPVRLDVGQVVYVTSETDEPRVGFG
jgi:hypothetical protein